MYRMGKLPKNSNLLLSINLIIFSLNILLFHNILLGNDLKSLTINSNNLNESEKYFKNKELSAIQKMSCVSSCIILFTAKHKQNQSEHFLNVLIVWFSRVKVIHHAP